MKALFVGSFDPFTLGHKYIAEQASRMFDELVVGIACNPDKKCMFGLTRREDWIRESLKDLDNVDVVAFGGLTVDFCNKNGIDVMVRGVRNGSDFDYEKSLSDANLWLNPNVQTIFIPTHNAYQGISSTLVRTAFENGHDILPYVPKEVYRGIMEKKL